MGIDHMEVEGSRRGSIILCLMLSQDCRDGLKGSSEGASMAESKSVFETF